MHPLESRQIGLSLPWWFQLLYSKIVEPIFERFGRRKYSSGIPGPGTYDSAKQHRPKILPVSFGSGSEILIFRSFVSYAVSTKDQNDSKKISDQRSHLQVPELNPILAACSAKLTQEPTIPRRVDFPRRGQVLLSRAKRNGSILRWTVKVLDREIIAQTQVWLKIMLSWMF